jgi:hypothetical protein
MSSNPRVTGVFVPGKAQPGEARPGYVANPATPPAPPAGPVGITGTFVAALVASGAI